MLHLWQVRLGHAVTRGARNLEKHNENRQIHRSWYAWILLGRLEREGVGLGCPDGVRSFSVLHFWLVRLGHAVTGGARNVEKHDENRQLYRSWYARI